MDTLSGNRRETAHESAVSRRIALRGIGGTGMAAALAMAAAGRGWSQAAAQEGSPSPEAIAVNELDRGVTAELFASIPSARAPGQTIHLVRLTFQPDAEAAAHQHPGTVVLAVAEGALGFTLLEGSAQVVRGSAAGATGPTEEVTEPGTDVVLQPGDAIFYEDDVVHTARGAADTETLVLGTMVLTGGEPLFTLAEMEMDMDMDGDGTPTS